MAMKKTGRKTGFTFTSEKGKAFVSKTKVVKDFVSGVKRRKK
ncbi:hypothetical protein LCGC14_1237210 [marine sediment metagenome]|uniref:Uncharacterized protein n=1 Tax=marine sediment metagenome TaxID=412755 RepID=A0A0F9LB22_9ZZZZ